ncbi:MAG: hypothetical protein FJY07_00770, partial [Bacteroidetes bacterium]|nr:hypothetical protein [Bacteroidota bacterium]
EQGFPNATDFYEARKGNFLTYQEFIECRKAGITDRGLLVNAQRGGFIENFEAFKNELAEARVFPAGTDKSKLDSAIALYRFSYQKGFKDYQEFHKAFFSGFPDKALYDLAMQHGFLYAEDYMQATKAGFVNAESYNKAMVLNIKTGHDYFTYLDFEKKAAGKLGFDEVELLKELSKFENGKKLSLKKLTDLVQEILEKHKTEDENGKKILPGWFKCNLNNSDDIAAFLSGNEDVKKNGHYDKEGEFFEISRISDKKIYLDGSNVAYASADRGSGIKPKYQNILLMANKLKSLRFTEIYVIADSSLRHAVTDAHIYDKVKNSVKYLEAPSHTSADDFLLQKVKFENCYLISNDTFKDWMFKDPWIANNIDRVRVPFMIINNEVSVPMLENNNGKNK